jgi:hypothetical protein
LHLLGLGSHLLLGRRSLFSSRLRLCPRRHRCLRLQLIAERPKVLELSKRNLEWQGRPSRGTPTPPGYGYLTRHLPHRATHTRLSGSASRQASPSARNEGETRLHAKIPRCSGPDSHNEHTPVLKVPLQTELRFHSRGYEQPPHRRACGTTNSGWLAGNHYSSSDDLRANAAVGRPSPTSPHEGRGQAVKAKEPEVCPRAAPTVSSAEKTSSGGHPGLHQQIPTQVLADGQAQTSARRHHAGVRTRQSKNTNAALAACDVLDGPPVRTAQQPPVRWADSHAPPQRWEVAPEAALEPAEPASQACRS